MWFLCDYEGFENFMIESSNILVSTVMIDFDIFSIILDHKTG